MNDGIADSGSWERRNLGGYYREAVGWIGFVILLVLLIGRRTGNKTNRLLLLPVVFYRNGVIGI